METPAEPQPSFHAGIETTEQALDSKAHNERMKDMFKRLIAVLAIGALLGVSVVGCNTFRGAGKDIQRGGEAVENAAEAAQ